MHAGDPNSPQLNPIAQRRAAYARSLLCLALGVQGVGAAGKEQVVGGVQQLAHHHVVRQPAGALGVELWKSSRDERGWFFTCLTDSMSCVGTPVQQ